MMKTLITMAGMIIFMLCQGACRTSRNSDRQQARIRLEEKSAVKSQVDQFNTVERYTSVIDSNGQNYQLTIFPSDTFRFSIRDGFIGKASRVIITGEAGQRIRLTDTSKTEGYIRAETDEKISRDVTATTELKATSVKRRGLIWMMIFASFIAGLTVLRIWSKFRGENNPG